jgi:predicted small lipoprotein YifL
MTAGRFLVMAAALVAVMATVSGCGRRADPETPYQAAVDARKEAQRNKVTPLPPEPEKPQTDKPFILDKLIK